VKSSDGNGLFACSLENESILSRSEHGNSNRHTGHLELTRIFFRKVAYLNCVTSANMQKCFRETMQPYILQLPAHAGSSLADFSTLKMEAIRSSETSVQLTTYTRRHTPEDGILHSHRRENLKSYIKDT
jgi:hypothetical protein